MKKIKLSVCFATFLLFSFLLGIWLGNVFLTRKNTRKIDSSKAETCLKIFIQHKKTGDTEQLRANLTSANISPDEFQKIIDRFLYFRIRKSALEQAMKLLQAFKEGYNIVPKDVFGRSDTVDTSFHLDAEILTLFNEKPSLIKEAFDEHLGS